MTESSSKPAHTDPAPAGKVARLIQCLSACANDSRLAWLGAVVVSGMVAIASMIAVVDPDFGWHLALGRFIADSGVIPDTEVLTHTAFGVPMVAHEWLSQLLMYRMTELWGVFGVRWLLAGLGAGATLMLFVWLRRDRVPPALSLLGVLVYLMVAQGRFQPRPHMFHLALFTALYGYLFIGRPRLKPVELVGIAAATAIWANLHSAVLIFPALVGLYVAVELLQQWVGWRQPQPGDLGEGKPGRLLLLGLAVLVGVCCTPHALELIPYVLESIRINSYASTEWFPMTHFWERRARMNYTVETFWVLAAATWLVAIVRVRRVSISQWVVVLALSCMPLVGSRHLIVYLAPVIFLFGELARWLERRPMVGARAVVQSFIPIIAMAVSLVIATQVLSFPKGFEWVGRFPRAADNFRADVFPIGAVRFLNEVEMQARLYTPSRWGGYVSWETRAGHLTFSDGRWVTLGAQIVNDSQKIEYREVGTARTLKEYGVDLLLVPRGWMKSDGAKWSQGWETLFENVNAGVYLRRAPQTRADSERVRAYYESRRIAFDSDSGFAAAAAAAANPRWAKRFQVKSSHIEQFRKSAGEVARGFGKRVSSW